MTLKNLTQAIALALGATVAVSATADPRIIGAGDLRPVTSRTAFSLFYVDFTKVTLTRATALATLQTRLNAAGEGRTACLVVADLNANNINCGNGLMNLGPDYFSYHNATHHPAPLITWTADDARTGLDRTSVEYGNNARSPTVLGTPIDQPRVFQIRFNRRIAQFGFEIDPFMQIDTADLTEGRLVDGLQFIVNGITTPVRDLTGELRGNVPFVGVEDPHGFTEVTVIATGGGAVLADRYTVVPLSNF